MTSGAHVRMEGVRKSYGGVVALADLHLELRPGITGLLGPNGAGKTTLIRILATLLAPSAGEVGVNGWRAASTRDRVEIRRRLGYLPQDLGLYPRFTVFEFVDYLALLKELEEPAERYRRVCAALEAVEQEDLARRKIRTLSGGMRRRVGIAQAIVADPELLLLDEPTTGLDPEQRMRFRQLIAGIGEHRTVVLSTHLVEDVAAVCTAVVVLWQGRVRFHGIPLQLRRLADGQVSRPGTWPARRCYAGVRGGRVGDRVRAVAVLADADRRGPARLHHRLPRGAGAVWAGAWLGLRDRVSGAADLVTVTPMAPWKLWRARLAGVAVVAAGAYAAVLAATLAVSAARGGHGTPDLRLLADGMLALVLSGLVGVAVGRLSGSRAVALLAGPVWFVLCMVAGDPWGHRLSPALLQAGPSSAEFGLLPDPLWPHLGYLLGLVLLAGVLLLTLAARGSSQRPLLAPMLVAAVAGLVLVGAGGARLVTLPEAVVPLGPDRADWKPGPEADMILADSSYAFPRTAAPPAAPGTPRRSASTPPTAPGWPATCTGPCSRWPGCSAACPVSRPGSAWCRWGTPSAMAARCSWGSRAFASCSRAGSSPLPTSPACSASPLRRSRSTASRTTPGTPSSCGRC
jgi:ABC-2 type transport system ATP-binding protein